MKKIANIIALILLCLITFAACVDDNGNDDGKVDDSANLNEISSIAVFAMPDRTFYSIGESFSASGGSIKITRKNSKTETIPMTDSNIVIACPNKLLFWTENQRIGVKYYDELTSKYTDEVYFGVKVGIDNDKTIPKYTAWNNDFIYLFYPSDYDAKPNEGSSSVGGVNYIDYTYNIVTFAESGTSNFSGTSKSISIKQGKVSALLNAIDQPISELNSHYTESYQTVYRQHYDDNSLKVSVVHQAISSKEYAALQHFQWKGALHQIITIEKSGTFLGLNDWIKRIDFYLIEGDGYSVDIGFHANNSTFDKDIIENVLSNLHVKYSAVYTDA